MAKITAIEDDVELATYDIWNKEPDCHDGQGNFVIDGLVVHNSILSNGVRVFEDLLFYNAAGHPGPMQCCWSHSKIDTEIGQTEIKDLDPKKHHIIALTNSGAIKTTNKYKPVESGIKPLIKIRLKNGKEIVVTKDHKILTPNGYVAAGELNVGQKVAFYRESHSTSPKQV